MLGRIALFAAGLAVLGILLTACPSHGPNRADEIVIGVVAPFTGPLGHSARPTLDGLALAVEEIQRGGGLVVDGRSYKFRLVAEDSQGRADVAVTKAIKLISSDRAEVLVGLTVSRSAAAVARLAENHRVPVITTLATHPDVTRGRHYVFRLIFTDDVQGQALALFARRDLGARSAAVLADAGSLYSQGLARCFRQTFEAQGGRVTAFESFLADHLEAAEPFERLRRARADLLLLPTHSSLITHLVRSVRASGIEAPLLGGDAWGLNEFAPNPRRQTAYYADIWTPDMPTVASRHFVAAYRDVYGKMPQSAAALAYDAIFLVAEAVRRQGQAGSESIRLGLRALESFEGVTGPLAFEDGGDPRRNVVILRVDTDGTQTFHKVIETAELEDGAACSSQE